MGYLLSSSTAKTVCMKRIGHHWFCVLVTRNGGAKGSCVRQNHCLVLSYRASVVVIAMACNDDLDSGNRVNVKKCEG